MPAVDRNRIAKLIRTWRAFEGAHAESAERIRWLAQNACGAIAEKRNRETLLADDTIRSLRNDVTPIAGMLGFDALDDGEFIFWATSLCLYLTAE